MLKNKKLLFCFYVAFVFVLNFGIVAVHAEGTSDPLTVVNNFSNFVFAIIRAIGMIILGLGIVQIGMSLKSHDPSQRANGMLAFAGGLMITFAKEILNLIIGGM